MSLSTATTLAVARDAAASADKTVSVSDQEVTWGKSTGQHHPYRDSGRVHGWPGSALLGTEDVGRRAPGRPYRSGPHEAHDL
jgi:hypothetical protein